MRIPPPPVSLPPPPVRIEGVELVRLELPLVRPFRTSFGTEHTRDVLLVRARTTHADGWGECSAPASPAYSSEYTAGAAHVIEHHLAPHLVAGGAIVSGADVPGRLAAVKGHPMAKAALELAVLDAQLRTAGVPLGRHLGGVRRRVPAGVSVGIPEGGNDALVEQVEAYLDAGYRRVKLKVEPGWDVAPVTAVRDRFGPEVPLQVDANAAYDPDAPEHLAALDDLDDLELELIEQPFAATRVRDHARLAPRWRAPLCLDESIGDAIQARDAVETGACAIVNIKIGRVGGLVESVRIHDTCWARGVAVWCGGMLETGIGRAANVALASLPGFVLPGDTSASDRYWVQDITEPFVLEDGHLTVPTEPGIGRTPRPEVLGEAEITTVAL